VEKSKEYLILLSNQQPFFCMADGIIETLFKMFLTFHIWNVIVKMGPWTQGSIQPRWPSAIQLFSNIVLSSESFSGCTFFSSTGLTSLNSLCWEWNELWQLKKKPTCLILVPFYWKLKHFFHLHLHFGFEVCVWKTRTTMFIWVYFF